MKSTTLSSSVINGTISSIYIHRIISHFIRHKLYSQHFQVGSSGQHFVDTIEDLKSSDEEERKESRRKVFDGNGSRRSSIYFDESDGPFGTWKRVKLDK